MPARTIGLVLGLIMVRFAVVIVMPRYSWDVVMSMARGKGRDKTSGSRSRMWRQS